MDNTYREFTERARRVADEYYELRRQESAKRDGEFWFVHDELSGMAMHLCGCFEILADQFQREARFFRNGRVG